MPSCVRVRIPRRNGKSSLCMAGRRGDGDQVNGMGDKGCITSADRQKGRRKRMTNQPQRPQVVVARARRSGDRYGIVSDASIRGGHHDGDRAVPFGQSHLMPGRCRLRIRRQNGNCGLGMVGYGSHRSHRSGCGNSGPVAGCARHKDRRQSRSTQPKRLQSVVARGRRRLLIRIYSVIPWIRHPHGQPIRP